MTASFTLEDGKYKISQIRQQKVVGVIKFPLKNTLIRDNFHRTKEMASESSKLIKLTRCLIPKIKPKKVMFTISETG
jgi:hypothetical protein